MFSASIRSLVSRIVSWFATFDIPRSWVCILTLSLCTFSCPTLLVQAPNIWLFDGLNDVAHNHPIEACSR